MEKSFSNVNIHIGVPTRSRLSSLKGRVLLLAIPLILATVCYSVAPEPTFISKKWLMGTVPSAFDIGIGQLQHRSSVDSDIVGTVAWHPECWKGQDPIPRTECGHIIVPKDYHNSNAGRTKIALARLKARNQPPKGSVFFNPGGPGNSGKQWIGAANPFRDTVIDPRIGDYYDIVGFDPRGMADTRPQMKCFTSESSYSSFIRNTVLERSYGFPHNMSTDEIRPYVLREERDDDALLKTMFEVCHEAMGDELRYMGTTTVVRDIDFMSKVIDGEDAPINYYGVSYGSVLGQYLVNMLPDRVGKVIIDGVADAELWSSKPAYLWHREWLSHTERTYDAFFRECSKSGPARCALTKVRGEDPAEIKNRLEGFFDDLYYRPLSSPKAAHPNILTNGRARMRLMTALYFPSTWPSVASSFAQAISGNGTDIINDLDIPPGQDISRIAVSCNDQPPFGDGPPPMVPLPTVEDIVKERLDVYENVSRFVFAIVATEKDAGCQYWGITPPERFSGPWNQKLRNPILVVSNTLDPVTPITSGQAAARRLGESARLLVLDSPGHTSFVVPTECIEGHIKTFFENGTLPPEGTICSVSAGPFD